ncbi:MAG: S8 family serine peptidase, partial [Candidatus Dadabacteria bacterium]|nr:S8 family serine peptidase [Candidatus Dadabacteria bacterium]
LHDFGLASQGPSAVSMPIVVGGTVFSPNNFIAVILQWNDPFGRSSNDYDLFLFDEEGTLLDSSTVIQDGTQDPIEVVVFDNNSAENKLVHLVIERFSGDEKILEMQFNGLISIEDFNVPGDSIYGHAAAKNNVTVGAVPVGNPDIIEPFSSLGPVSIFFNPVQVTNSLNSSSPLITTSNNIPTEVRQKPDVVAPDFTNTSIDGFAPFAGTSVSAPHAAGVVALIIEAQALAQSQVTPLNNQFNKTNLVNDPMGIIDILKQNAVDLGAPGPDNIFGFGRVDALAAVQAVLPEGPPVMPPDDGDDIIIDPPPAFNNTSSGGCSLISTGNYSGIYSNLLILLVVLSIIIIKRLYKTNEKQF